jgi:hypothetical protein
MITPVHSAIHAKYTSHGDYGVGLKRLSFVKNLLGVKRCNIALGLTFALVRHWLDSDLVTCVRHIVTV